MFVTEILVLVDIEKQLSLGTLVCIALTVLLEPFYKVTKLTGVTTSYKKMVIDNYKKASASGTVLCT